MSFSVPSSAIENTYFARRGNDGTRWIGRDGDNLIAVPVQLLNFGPKCILQEMLFEWWL